MRSEVITKSKKRRGGLSSAEREALLDRLEDLEDEIEALKVIAHGGPSPDALPHEYMGRIIKGDHPLLVWREYRGLTQKELAAKAGLKGNQYISEIEQGLKTGSAKTLQKLAKALACPVDVLISD